MGRFISDEEYYAIQRRNLRRRVAAWKIRHDKLIGIDDVLDTIGDFCDAARNAKRDGVRRRNLNLALHLADRVVAALKQLSK